MLSTISYRDAEPDDAEALWSFLAIAAYEPDAAAAKSVPVVAAHLLGWRRPEDFGVLAERDGRPVGAAWARQFHPGEEPTVFIGPNTPEISIGVLAEERGQGVGFALLERLADMAISRSVDGLCLNVRDNNPATRLYERTGFRRIRGSEVRNRVGGLSFGMLRCFRNQTA